MIMLINFKKAVEQYMLAEEDVGKLHEGQDVLKGGK